MPKQTTTWTVLPNGSDGNGTLFFSVHVAPRLVADGFVDATLANFSAWTDWPATLSGLNFALKFTDISGSPVSFTRAPGADSARWKALFPASTLVRARKYIPHTFTPIWSYPATQLHEFIASQWSSFAATSPDEFPSFGALMAAGAFGPLGFEQQGDLGESGPERRARLDTQMRGYIDTSPASTPAQWVVPELSNAGDDLSLNVLQLFHFLRRDLVPQKGPRPELKPTQLDFHEVVSLARDHPLLCRLLGLTFDAQVSLRLAGGPLTSTGVMLTIEPEDPSRVTPVTESVVGAGRFEPVAKDPVSFQRGHLPVGDTSAYDVVVVDPDGAVVRAQQLADSVARSRIWNDDDPAAATKRTRSSPDSFALPALRTGGLSVVRRRRAEVLAGALAAAATLDGQFVTPNGEPTGQSPKVYAEDVIRGWRWDAIDASGGTAPSLMGRKGEYHFLTQAGPAGTVEVVDEATLVSSPTTSGSMGDRDLYQQESLLLWRGFSLAGSRPGTALPAPHGPGLAEG